MPEVPELPLLVDLPVRRPLSIAVAAAVLAACGCGGSGGAVDAPADDAPAADARPVDAAPLRCPGEWPQAPPPNRRPPLGVSPSLLWTKPLGWEGLPDHIILAGNRIAMTLGARLLLLDRSGAVVDEVAGASGERLSTPTADPSGNFYFGGANAYSVTADGGVRWLAPFEAPRIEGHPGATRLLLSPEGILYVAAMDGYLYALRAADGSVAWRREVGLWGIGVIGIGPGMGDTLQIGSTVPDQLIDSHTGEPRGALTAADGRPYPIDMFGFGGHIIASRTEGELSTPKRPIFGLEPCGAQRWALPATSNQAPALMAWDGRVIVVDGGPSGSPINVRVYGPDGQLLAGPVRTGAPLLLAADETVIGLACDSGDPVAAAPWRLIALSVADLSEQWRLELPGPCANGAVALADDGVLYMARRGGPYPASSEILAIQTPSPGLANSSWPLWYTRDNLGTRWLAP